LKWQAHNSFLFSQLVKVVVFLGSVVVFQLLMVATLPSLFIILGILIMAYRPRLLVQHIRFIFLDFLRFLIKGFLLGRPLRLILRFRRRLVKMRIKSLSLFIGLAPVGLQQRMILLLSLELHFRLHLHPRLNSSIGDKSPADLDLPMDRLAII
jgi:hypothetical protein